MADNPPSELRDRIAAIITEHDRCDEWGGPDWYCGADDCSESGNDQQDYAAHLAVLITEMGLTGDDVEPWHGKTSGSS